jgi:hypothetical protein
LKDSAKDSQFGFNVQADANGESRKRFGRRELLAQPTQQSQMTFCPANLAQTMRDQGLVECGFFFHAGVSFITLFRVLQNDSREHRIMKHGCDVTATAHGLHRHRVGHKAP